jgi:hypothetical protein
MAREGVRICKDVAVEVHGDLGRAGGSRRRSQKRNVIGCGFDIGEVAALGGAPGNEVICTRAAIRHHRDVVACGEDHFVHKAVIRDRQNGPGQPEQRGNFGRAQDRHRGDNHGAGFQDSQPGRDNPRVVGTAKHDAVAGYDAKVLREDLGRLISVLLELAVAPGCPVRGVQRGAGGSVFGHSTVNKYSAGIEHPGVLEFRQGKLQRRPHLGGRQVVTGKGVHMG